MYGYDAVSVVTKRYIKLVNGYKILKYHGVSVISPFEKDRLECKDSLMVIDKYI